jgi:hypothetical protein
MKQQKLMLNKWQMIVMSGANWMRYVIIIALVAFLVLGATSCSKQKLEPGESTDGIGMTTIGSGEPEKEFNVDLFLSRVNTSLMFSGNSSVRGYSIVVTRNGQVLDTASAGWGYRYTTGGYSPMHVKQEMQIASLTKTITAVAVIQLLKKNELNINAKIGPYVPAYWNAKQAIKDLTFKDLMTHS